MADISKINPNGTEYNLKDATARSAIENTNENIQSSITVPKASVVTVTDAAPINAEDITVDITPQQDLHGYGRPWAGGAGKNKLEVPSSISFSHITDGVIKDNGKNGIRITGHKTTGGWGDIYFTDIELKLSANTSYVLSCGMVPSNVRGLTLMSGNTSVCNIATGASEASYTPDADVTITQWRVIITDNAESMLDFVLYPMVRLATETDATFAPYSNICPIEGRTGAELDRVGKNWFTTDANDYEVGTIDPSTGALLNDSNYKRTKEYLPIRAGSYKLINAYNFRIFLYDSSKNYLGYVDGASVMTISNLNVAFYKARWPAGNDMSTAMLFLSSFIDSTYELYQGQQYTASFGETVHGGKWHVTAGGTDKTYGYVEFDGSDDEDWAKYTGGSASAFAMQVTISNFSGISSSIDKLSANYLQTIPASATWGNYDSWISAYGVANKITTGLKSITTVEEWRAYLAQHPLQICYELATPTTISTPKQNVPMLQGINTVSADCGDTQLKYQPDNVVGELKGEIEDNIIYEDYKWTTESSRTYSAGTPGTYGCSSWRDVKKEGYDVIGVTFIENRRFGDCILTLYYIPSTSHVEVIIFRATSSSVTIADEDITYRVAYKKH